MKVYDILLTKLTIHRLCKETYMSKNLFGRGAVNKIMHKYIMFFDKLMLTKITDEL